MSVLGKIRKVRGIPAKTRKKPSMRGSSVVRVPVDNSKWKPGKQAVATRTDSWLKSIKGAEEALARAWAGHSKIPSSKELMENNCVLHQRRASRGPETFVVMSTFLVDGCPGRFVSIKSGYPIDEVKLVDKIVVFDENDTDASVDEIAKRYEEFTDHGFEDITEPDYRGSLKFGDPKLVAVLVPQTIKTPLNPVKTSDGTVRIVTNNKPILVTCLEAGEDSKLVTGAEYEAKAHPKYPDMLLVKVDSEEQEFFGWRFRLKGFAP